MLSMLKPRIFSSSHYWIRMIAKWRHHLHTWAVTDTWHPSPPFDPILTTAGILQDSGSQAKTLVTSGKKKHRRNGRKNWQCLVVLSPIIPFWFWQSLTSPGDARMTSPLAVMGSTRNRAVPLALLLTLSHSASPSEPGRLPCSHLLVSNTGWEHHKEACCITPSQTAGFPSALVLTLAISLKLEAQEFSNYFCWPWFSDEPEIASFTSNLCLKQLLKKEISY